MQIVGKQRDTIEVYFHNEGVNDHDVFDREPPFPDSSDLNCGDHVILAPKNSNGTFAIVYGKHRNKVSAFGWQKGDQVIKRFDVPLDTTGPVRAKWITGRILKIQYGRGYTQEYVLQFFDPSNMPWQQAP